MKTILVAKAQPTAITHPAPDVTIQICAALPDFHVELDVWDAFCDREAETIEDALISALPGGVYDRLLGLMLKRKASHFRVSHIKSSDVEEGE